MNESREALRMLSTDMAWQVIRGGSVKIEQRLIDMPAQQVCISTVTRAELRYELLCLSGSPAVLRVQEFLKIVRALPWDAAAADKYAELRVSLARLGRDAGDKDVGIAAHALTAGAVLVTTDTAPFLHICSGLTLETWSEA